MSTRTVATPRPTCRGRDMKGLRASCGGERGSCAGAPPAHPFGEAAKRPRHLTPPRGSLTASPAREKAASRSAGGRLGPVEQAAEGPRQPPPPPGHGAAQPGQVVVGGRGRL